MPPIIAIDESLVTSSYSYPFQAEWLTADGVQLLPGFSKGADTNATPDFTVALLDSAVAHGLLDRCAIVRDVAISCRRASMVTLATHTRPDEVDDVALAAPGVSPATRVMARIVVTAFYGIRVTRWTDEALPVVETLASVTEGAPALVAIDDEHSYQEDLGRAWFLLTDTPFVSHVCLARRDALADDPQSVTNAVQRLLEARELAKTRGRELRRDVSRAAGVEREVLTDALADQTLHLGDDELRGLLELWRRAGIHVRESEVRAGMVNLTPQPPSLRGKGELAGRE